MRRKEMDENADLPTVSTSKNTQSKTQGKGQVMVIISTKSSFSLETTYCHWKIVRVITGNQHRVTSAMCDGHARKMLYHFA